MHPRLEKLFKENPALDNYIPKKDMVVGREYLCKARNFEVGTWNGVCFQYLRTKFGQTFQDTEQHWDDGAPFGTAKPLELLPEH